MAKKKSFKSIFHNKDQLELACCGYIRQDFDSAGVFISPTDIAILISKFLYYNTNVVDWRWNYCFDYKNRGKKIHCIKNNGKTIGCCFNSNYVGCNCFFRINTPMGINSGVYRIKFYINSIKNDYCNIIGITCNTNDKNNCQHSKLPNCWYYSHDYIGWSSFGQKDPYLPNGLLCGYDDPFHNDNIFIKKEFKYQSNNPNHYLHRLPRLRPNDIVILTYDSDNGILWFGKENDDKLDAFIKKLPRNQTFYWMVGHHYKPFAITIV